MPAAPCRGGAERAGAQGHCAQAGRLPRAVCRQHGRPLPAGHQDHAVGAAQRSAAQHGTARHGTLQHSTAQHGRAQPSLVFGAGGGAPKSCRGWAGSLAFWSRWGSQLVGAGSKAVYVLLRRTRGLPAWARMQTVTAESTAAWLGPGRGAVRLYTDFFQSDIIVASPLALATKLGEGPGEDGLHPQVGGRERAQQSGGWAHVLVGERGKGGRGLAGPQGNFPGGVAASRAVAGAGWSTVPAQQRLRARRAQLKRPQARPLPQPHLLSSVLPPCALPPGLPVVHRSDCAGAGRRDAHAELGARGHG